MHSIMRLGECECSAGVFETSLDDLVVFPLSRVEKTFVYSVAKIPSKMESR